VPNLLWKSRDGQVHDNDFSHLPDQFACGIDWSRQPAAPASAQLPIRELLSTQNAGCAFNCGWCGGSREAFRRIFKRQRAMARKPSCEVDYEFASMRQLPNIGQYHFYSVGSYNEPKNAMAAFLDRVGEADFRSVSYEQFYLTPDDVLRHMVKASRRTVITLSPESHDLRVAKLAGRGVYTNDELEAWIEKALDFGIHQIDLWYFIGMPEQDAVSVRGTVEYCQHVLAKFRGRRVVPMLCPMIPFLDPASTFFEHPAAHGYRVFYRTVEEHRRGMERASVINRINYETRWLSRRDLVHVGFRAVRALMEVKREFALLPGSVVRDYVGRLDDALSFVDVVHEIDCLPDPLERRRELEHIGDEILRRNEQIFFSGVMNQAFPINRQIGGRWFDEMGWPAEVLERSASPDPIGQESAKAPARS
jgi:clorobiocin biosynthesis protein CloN6